MAVVESLVFITELPHAITIANATQRIQLFLSGVLGCALGACVFWCISETSATTLSFVGALNKLPLAILGAALFGSTTSATGWFYVVLNVSGSVVYVMAKAGLLGAGMSKDVCAGSRALRKLKAENEATEGNSKSPIEVMEGGSRRLDA